MEGFRDDDSSPGGLHTDESQWEGRLDIWAFEQGVVWVVCPEEQGTPHSHTAPTLHELDTGVLNSPKLRQVTENIASQAHMCRGIAWLNAGSDSWVWVGPEIGRAYQAPDYGSGCPSVDHPWSRQTSGTLVLPHLSFSVGQTCSLNPMSPIQVSSKETCPRRQWMESQGHQAPGPAQPPGPRALTWPGQ